MKRKPIEREAKFDDVLLHVVVEYDNEEGEVVELANEDFYAGEEDEALDKVKQALKYLERTVKCPRRSCKDKKTCDHFKEHTFSSLCQGHEHCPECTTDGK